MKSGIYCIIVTLILFMAGCKKKDYRMDGTFMLYCYEKQNYTAPPKGYEPFYINYIGRHGSRNPVSNEDLIFLIKKLKDAESKNALSIKGTQLLAQLQLIEEGLNGQWGKLTNKGMMQMKGIAQRMLHNYPALFVEHIYVQTDMVERCKKSMESFMSEFVKIIPKEQISIDVLPENNATLNFFDINLAYLKYKKEGEWRDLYHAYADTLLQDNRLLSDYFTDQYLNEMTHKIKFIHALYSTYAILPNTDLNYSLDNFFTGDEIYTLWNIQNVRQYLEKGPSPIAGGLQTHMSFPLLEDFLATSYNAIAEGGVSADFRFAHAETIIPFAALLQIPIASAQVRNLNLISKNWLDFQIAPMAANIQWIFYGNEEGDYIVKMLLNEKEVPFPIESGIEPYYEWGDVKNYYQNLLDSLPIMPSFSIEKRVKYFKEP